VGVGEGERQRATDFFFIVGGLYSVTALRKKRQ